jgi:hypothetical protein
MAVTNGALYFVFKCSQIEFYYLMLRFKPEKPENVGNKWARLTDISLNDYVAKRERKCVGALCQGILHNSHYIFAMGQEA